MAGGQAAATGILLSRSKSFNQVFIKFAEYVGGHNISTKFYNQLSPSMHTWIMTLKLSKIMVSALKVKEFLSCLD